MSYVGKNPKFTSNILTDQGVSAAVAAPTSSHRLINRSGKIYVVDSSGGETELGSGASGALNYITNPSGNSGTTGWANVGDLDIARTTTPGDLPREQLTPSGLKITADANTQSNADYVYFNFDLDDIDTNKVLSIEWSQKQTGSYVDGDLEVIIATQAAPTVAIATPVNTSIPAKDGTFSSSFLSTSDTAICLVIRATTDMATNAGIVISDVYVGSAPVKSGAIVGSWNVTTNSFTGSGGDPSKGSGGVDRFAWRRVGEEMEVHVTYSHTSGGSVGGGTYSLTLPGGLNIDTSRLGSPGAGIVVVGNGYAYNGTTEYLVSFVPNADTTKVALYQGATSFNGLGASNVSLALSTVVITGNFRVPILEWSGTGTMNALIEDNLSEWTAMSASQINWSLDADSKLYYRRIGSDMEVSIYGLISSASGDLTFTLPNGLTINDTIVDVTGSFVDAMDGRGLLLDSPTTYYDIFPFRSSSTAIRFRDIGSNNTVSSTTPFSVTSSDEFKLTLKIPITEWANVNQNSLVGFSTATATNAGLIPAYETTTATLDGAFTGGTRGITMTRIGNVVTITAQGISTFASATTISSNSNVVTSTYRPSDNVYTCAFYNGGAAITILIKTDGTVELSAAVARTDSGVVWTISYVIT